MESSGVISKTHEKTKTGISPIARIITTSRITDSSKLNMGISVPSTSKNNQQPAGKATPTLKTLRR